ncbi:TPA: hypothetical protein H1009_01650, partial [archaeon]|nr:hypothetical protein [Candidatus Naiadarchaeales archaeon SRR2090153.bin461]
MSSSGSSTGGKAVSVIVVLGVLVVALLAYNKICDECLFAFPEKGGGESGQSVIIAPGGTAPPPAGGFDFGSIIAAIILVGLLGGGAFVLSRRRRQTPTPAPVHTLPALPPGRTPPALPPGHDSTAEGVGKYDLNDAIERLADSYTNYALIDGRAARTIMEMAVVHQQKGPLESFGGLFGNFHSKNSNVIVPFAIPLPVFSANHGSVSPDWNLFKDVAGLAVAEFALGDKKAAEALIEDFKNKYKAYKAGYPPNEIIADIINKGLFDPITKERLDKIGYYFPSFRKGEVKAVGWYHNHPYTTGYPKDFLMKQSGADPRDKYYKKGDLACQCFFQHKWSSNNPVSVLVATHVLPADEIGKIDGIPVGFKVWKSTDCQYRRVRNDIIAGGAAKVKFKIFCLDEETYSWYREFAPKLIENGIVLDWYAEYYEKFVKPDRKSTKVPMEEYKKQQKKIQSIFDKHFKEEGQKSKAESSTASLSKEQIRKRDEWMAK